MVFLRSQTLEHEGDDDAAAEQVAANLAAFHLALIDNLVESN
jgi:hypothetical protein